MLVQTALGRETDYSTKYDASLLYPISRNIARQYVGIVSPISFYGFDIWNCYEVSWVNLRNKPEIRILTITVSADSENIIESKSLKLYLNSLHNMQFVDDQQITALLQNDLEIAVKGRVYLECKTLSEYQDTKISCFSGVNLDMIDVDIDLSGQKADLLLVSDDQAYVKETIYSNLLKSNCPVTNQPDWASIQISYYGRQLVHESMLKYIISLRNNQEFHEQCVERIFIDIQKILNPNELTVYARYTRRGGIDINPIRSTKDLNVTEISNIRQVRQ